MDEIINLLSTKLRANQCVLFLGPGVFKETPDAPDTIYEQFSAHCASRIDPTKMQIDLSQQKNIYYTVPRYVRSLNQGPFQRANVGDIKREFIQFASNKTAHNPIFKKLADLPFSIIVSTNPDQSIRALVPNGRKTFFSYYNSSNKSPDDLRRGQTLSADHFKNFDTVIYNLFGSYDTPSSLLLTEDDLITYVINVNQLNTRIPSALTNELDDNKYYIFLGFHFDQWILKILLRVLGLPKGDAASKITFTVNGQPPQIYLQHYYEDDFRFFFVPEGGIEIFLDRWKKAYDVLAAEPVTVRPVNVVRKKIAFVRHQSDSQDTRLHDKLDNQLQALTAAGKAFLWSEKIPDSTYDKEEMWISENLQTADVIVVMVSDSFMADYQNRLTWLAQVYNDKPVKPRVICVLLRPYNYQAVESLQGYTWLPASDAGTVQAVTQTDNEDEALRAIADYIGQQVEQMQ
jgi:hypothetical protein